MAHRTPYDAAHVAIARRPGRLVALYIPDPTQTRRPGYVLDHLLDQTRYATVQIIAEARRHYLVEGAHTAGWVISSRGRHSEPLPNLPAARTALHQAVIDYFTKEQT